MRNNVGKLKVADGSYRHFGLPNGSADLIGILGGRFVALETKTDIGKLSDDQKLWLALVRKRGGFACVVRSVSDAVSAIQRAREGLYE